MKLSMNIGILNLSTKLNLEYPTAIGIYLELKELRDSGLFDLLNEKQIIHELGFMSSETSDKLSSLTKDKMLEILEDIETANRREYDRNRKRAYRLRKKGMIGEG